MVDEDSRLSVVSRVGSRQTSLTVTPLLDSHQLYIKSRVVFLGPPSGELTCRVHESASGFNTRIALPSGTLGILGPGLVGVQFQLRWHQY
jgi:hypothetical protein